jgi:hypothetical protein
MISTFNSSLGEDPATSITLLELNFDNDFSISYLVPETAAKDVRYAIDGLSKVLIAMGNNESIQYEFVLNKFFKSMEFIRKEVNTSGSLSISIGNASEHNTAITIMNYPSLFEQLSELMNYLQLLADRFDI